MKRRRDWFYVIVGLVSSAYIMIFYDIIKQLLKPMTTDQNAVGMIAVAGFISLGIGLASAYFIAYKRI